MTESKVVAFQSEDIEYIFDNYPQKVREKCMVLRQLIFDIAAENPAIGPIEESIRWGEPCYLPSQTKSGSMIRMHHYSKKPFDFALYFLCQTKLVGMFRDLYPKTFQFGGNRSLEFMVSDPLPIKEIKECIKLTLTYYLEDHHTT